MTAFDMPLDQLYAYRPEREEPPDFDAFWTETARLVALGRRRRRPSSARERSAADARRSTTCRSPGSAVNRIQGWFLAPAGATAPLPTVVEYIGYGGGRASADRTGLTGPRPAMATSSWTPADRAARGAVGDTPDLDAGRRREPVSRASSPGVSPTPSTYYYRRLITDAVLAVDAASLHPVVDRDRIIVAGGSQGGGLALAVAALSRRCLAPACIDVPFMCHWRRSVEITDEPPYHELDPVPRGAP